MRAADLVTTGPLWVSLEGPEGVGKTHLARSVAARVSGCRLLEEITDSDVDPFTGAVVAALSAGGDRFLRTGHPRAETLALLALKARAREAVDALPAPPPVVLEDRGIDTVALYQAVILTPATGDPATDHDRAWSVAQQLYRAAAAWVALPDLTVLLLDDPDACAARWHMREGTPFTPDEQDLVRRATALYRRLADAEPGRVVVLDRGDRTEEQIVDALEKIVTAALRARDTGGGHVAAS
ncbi:hypothetical protein [Actinokineospora cianjurensis]|uniref:dTMP kinase n=1 Tax=Actinokineospora cianjurensis TaxID=585224 RepID=A0A421B1W3_9PSEU|nr:hypothetical protein [Actinokineospora cianjurensis]RLK58384.1 dTMP kinase [Actinokineospora cianjurensis]